MLESLAGYLKVLSGAKNRFHLFVLNYAKLQRTPLLHNIFIAMCILT